MRTNMLMLGLALVLLSGCTRVASLEMLTIENPRVENGLFCCTVRCEIPGKNLVKSEVERKGNVVNIKFEYADGQSPEDAATRFTDYCVNLLAEDFALFIVDEEESRLMWMAAAPPVVEAPPPNAPPPDKEP